jgi:hypothetical protein
MTATFRRPLTTGRPDESSSHRCAQPAGVAPGVPRAPAFDGRFDAVRDPDGEAGRGRLGHAY